jgi:hypothetical protein
MKKTYFVIIMIILFALLIIGCEKISMDSPDDPPVLTTYTITASVIGEGGSINPQGTFVVNEGSNKLFTFKKNPGVKLDSLIINGNYTLPTTDSTYFLNNIFSDYDVKVVFKEVVKVDLLTSGTWYWDTLVFHQADGVWTHEPIWGKENHTQEQVTFLTNGEVVSIVNGKDPGNIKWEIDVSKPFPILIWGGEFLKIEKLDAKIMILAGSNFKRIYSHHK